MNFTELIDLASERVGGQALAANDEFFAPKENLIKAGKPVSSEDKYTDRGKWMDGWETRRRRTPGHDWCVLRLGLPGVIRGALVDTGHFKGNYPESCSLDACEEEGTEWAEILPRSPLQGDTENAFPVDDLRRWTHVRLNIYPDGGVARLRVYGEVRPDWKSIGVGEADLAAAENGSLVMTASDMFFGSRHNLILPGPARNMGEGWETRRRRGPGHDWVILRLGAAGAIHRLEVDTSHFKGNYPESCSLEACDAQGTALGEILPRAPLGPDARHFFEKEIQPHSPVTHARFKIYPDGGLARLRLYGKAMFRPPAEAELLACCGSRSWVRRMADRQPFRDFEELVNEADHTWWDLGRDDWLEAFRSHPRIGEKSAGRWSQQEQAGTQTASEGTLAALAEANRAYEEKFGHIFIVCATGKTADEMLALLRSRLQNDADAEVRVAAEEQRRITRLRLEKLLKS